VHDHVDMVALVVAVHVRTKALVGLDDPTPIHRLISNACDRKTRVRRVNASEIENNRWIGQTPRRTCWCTRIGCGRQVQALAEYQDGVSTHVGNRQCFGFVSAANGTIDARRVAILARPQHTQTGTVDGLVEGVVESLPSLLDGVIHRTDDDVLEHEMDADVGVGVTYRYFALGRIKPCFLKAIPLVGRHVIQVHKQIAGITHTLHQKQGLVPIPCFDVQFKETVHV